MAKVIGLTVLVAALAFVSVASVARAQGPQWCPPAGSVIQVKSNQGNYTRITKGADPTDSAVCVGESTGPGANGINYGKTTRFIYGWYPLQNFAMTSETERKARAGLGAILSGQSEEVSFEMTNSRPGTDYVWSGTESWKRTGQATISIGGRPTNVITLRETFKGGASSNYNGYWDLWYDAVLHLFVKGEQHRTGEPARYGFEVLSVSSP